MIKGFLVVDVESIHVCVYKVVRSSADGLVGVGSGFGSGSGQEKDQQMVTVSVTVRQV